MCVRVCLGVDAHSTHGNGHFAYRLFDSQTEHTHNTSESIGVSILSPCCASRAFTHTLHMCVFAEGQYTRTLANTLASI